MEEENIIWLSKERIQNTSNQGLPDIKVYRSTSVDYKHRGDYTCIVFRNRTWEKVSKTGYAEIGIAKGRLYFKESDVEKGYKLAGEKKNHNAYTRCIKLKEQRLPIQSNCFEVGEYNLNYDSNKKMFYIAPETKVKK